MTLNGHALAAPYVSSQLKADKTNLEIKHLKEK